MRIFNKTDLFRSPCIKWRFLHRAIYSLDVEEEGTAGDFITV